MKDQMSIYYDEEGDFLEIMVGEPCDDYGDDISEDVVLFRSQKTDDVIGIGIFNFKKKTKGLDEIKIKLPVNINLSALKSM